MILTTSIKHSYTTTKHNHKSYIFTLYLFMFLCVVGNCLLFYCSCTGNCENCCGINGGIKDKIESENDEYENENMIENNKKNNSEINNQQNNEIKYKQNNENEIKIDKKKEEKKEDKEEEEEEENKEEEKKEEDNKEEEKKEEWEVDNKIKNENNDKIKNKIENNDKIDIKNKLEEVELNDGEIDDIQIVNSEFVKKKLVKAYGSSDNYERKKEEFINDINPTGETHLSAYVEVKKMVDNVVGYFIHCTNANSIHDEYDNYYGLFAGSEATKIVILSCGSEIENMINMFYNCQNLKELDLSKFNTTNVTAMNSMFHNCSSLKVLNLSKFNTDNVTDMRNMFSGCSSLIHLDLSKFNTQNVTDMFCMFNDCSSLTKIIFPDNVNTENVTNMSFMFNECSKLTKLNLSSFNTTNVTDMQYMFYECSSLKELDLSKLKIDKVTDMSSMFYNCFKEEQTSCLICTASTIQKITEKENSCLIIPNDNKDKINDKLNKNLDQVCTCTVERCKNEDNPKIISVYKFKDMPSDGRIEGIKIVNVNFAEGIKYVPIGSEVDKQALEKIIESIKPTGETYLSAYVEVKKKDDNVVGYLIYCTDANSKNKNGLFQWSAATKIEILSCGSKIKNMSRMFNDCSSLTELDLSNFNTSNVTDMFRMFYNCSKLTKLNLSHFITSNVTDMSLMFYKCSGLKELNLSNFNTSKVENMNWMFAGCSSLTKLDLSKFNTSNVTDMFGMFYNCSSLTNINLSKFNTKKVTDMSSMFYNCFKEKQTSFLICKASTLKKITDETKNSCLIITNENENKINAIIGNEDNLDKVYTCIVKRCRNEDNPQITEVVEYKLEEISYDGKIDDIQIVNVNFSGRIKYVPIGSEVDKQALEKIIESIKPTGETYLSAYVEVKSGDIVKLRYFIHCTDANSKNDNYYGNYDGLFAGSEATKIVILRCGSEIKDMRGMFDDCSSLKELDLSKLKTDNVTNMSYMFNNCSSLTNINLSSFNTENVTSMFGMFYKCSSLTKIIFPDNLNINKVKDMRGMFYNCSSLTNLDLSKFNTNKVTNMFCMFYNCFKEKQTSFLICKASTIQNITEKENSYLTITNENENEIKNTLNKNLEQVYTCTVKRGESEHRPQITSVVKSDKAKLFKLKDMSKDCKIDGKRIVRKEFVNLVKYVPIMGNEYDKQIIDDDSFIASIALTGQTYLSAYVEVGNTARYFIHCTDANSINGTVFCYGLFHGSKATKIVILSCGNGIKNMSYMFYNCTSLTNINLSKLKTDNVTNMSYMFNNCSSLTNIKFPDNVNTNSVTDMRYMFYNCSKLTVLNLSNFNTVNVINMGSMFSFCSSLNNLDLSSFNTNNVTNMYCMFYNCSSLTNINLSSFNTNNVTNMRSMFYNCTSLTNLNLSKFNTTNVTNMTRMFSDCSKLTKLNLSSFNTDNVTEMSYMFSGCSNLTQLDLTSFNTKKVTNMMCMFYNCFPNKATLMCQASTIQEITDDTKNSCLIIPNENENNDEIKKTINTVDNKEQVYICSVKRGGSEHMPQITSVAKLFKLKNMPESGKIDNTQIVSKKFSEANLVKYVQIVWNEDDKQMIDEGDYIAIDIKDPKHLSAYVKVEDNGKVKLRCFIECKNSNTKSDNINIHYYGLFQGSKATKIEIQTCGSGIKNMSWMFSGCSNLTILDLSKFNTVKVTDVFGMFSFCSSLTKLNLSNFNTYNVTDMRAMFFNCSSLKELDLSKFNTTNVTDMSYMFADCSTLTNLNLSKFNTDKVEDVSYMFNNCFEKKQTSTLICTASTIQKITNSGDSYLTITNDKKTGINNTLNENKDKVYKCTVKREGKDSPEVADIVLDGSNLNLNKLFF